METTQEIVQSTELPDYILKRINAFGLENWEKAQKDVAFSVRGILVPGFQDGLRWKDESEIYSLSEARDSFERYLPRDSQLRELWRYFEKTNIDDEAFFHGLLGMTSWHDAPYLFLGGRKLEVLGLLRKYHGLITATPFGPLYSSLDQRGSRSTNGCIERIVPDRKAYKKGKFRIRLQAA